MGTVTQKRAMAARLAREREEYHQRLRLDRTMCALAAVIALLFVIDIFLRLR
jgi:hypothetical protein